MKVYETLKHTTWDCKYHVIFIPKCRRKVVYGQLRRELGTVFRALAQETTNRFERFALRGQARGSFSQAAKRSLEVVFVGVVAGRCIDFAQVEEEFAIQQFQAHLGMEAFHISFFPRSAGLDIAWSNLRLVQPSLHVFGRCTT